MYIVVIAWTFVALIIAVCQASVVAALLSFLFWGILPLGLILWLLGSPTRRRLPATSSRAEKPSDNTTEQKTY